GEGSAEGGRGTDRQARSSCDGGRPAGHPGNGESRGMTSTWQSRLGRTILCTAVLVAFAAGVARADVSGSYDGTLAVTGGPGAVAGAPLPAGRSGAGTPAPGMGGSAAARVYTGTARAPAQRRPPP